jgi:type I restriction enzyme S subunit
MKDSGIDWIGNVPMTWKLSRTKYYGTIKSGESISIDELKDDDPYPVWGGNGLMGFTYKYNESKTSIVIGRVGALCGNVRLLTSPTYVSDNALIFRLNKKANAKFMLWLLTGANLNRLNTSNAQPLITGTKVINVDIPIPSISEQEAIADYLDDKCSQIDSIISNKENLISQLQEYRKSIIFEYVTGKKEVPNG